MQFEPTPDQSLMVDSFARFLNANSSPAQLRAALPTGFDAALWTGLADLGALAIRVPEEAGGLGLGIFDAALLMEEAGRTLASGPLAEAIVSARLLARLAAEPQAALLEAAAAGTAILTLALHDIASRPTQLVAGGAIANAVLAHEGDEVFLIQLTPGQTPEPTLASTPIARLNLKTAERIQIGQGPQALAAFAEAVEEWKLLIAAALAGLSRESLRLASTYANERTQFGRPIGSYQAVSHPLAMLSVEVDAGRYMVWRAIRDLADNKPNAAAAISTAAWWAADVAERTTAQSLHSFGGYGLTLEYDIHLFNLRAKAWPLVLGDPALLLAEAGRRRYLAEPAHLPEPGPVPVEFELGPDADALAAEVRSFFDANLTPELRAKAHHSFDGHDPGIFRKLAEASLLYPHWPRRMGGRDATPYAARAARRIWEENGWSTNFAGTTNIVGFIADRFASDEVRNGPLSDIIAGSAVASLGFSEPHAGSDVFAAKTRATQQPDGSWRIDGQKMFTSGAEQADYVILLARSDPEAQKHKGLTVFLVPLKSPGVTIQAIHTFQDERTNITYYDSVAVPDSYRLGEIGGGLNVMAASLEIEHGMSFVDPHAHALHAAERILQPSLHDPLIRFRLARVAANVEASELMLYRALWAVTEKKPGPAFGPSSKMFSSEVYRADSAELLNLTAPESLTLSSPDIDYLNEAYRLSQVATVYGGTSEIHRSVIAEKQLGLPRTR